MQLSGDSIRYAERDALQGLSALQLQQIVDDTLIELIDSVSQMPKGKDVGQVSSSAVIQELIDTLSYQAGHTYTFRNSLKPELTENAVIAIQLLQSIERRLVEHGFTKNADNYKAALGQLIDQLRDVRDRAIVVERSSGDAEQVVAFFKEKLEELEKKVENATSAGRILALETGKDIQQAIKMEQYDFDVLKPLDDTILQLQQLILSKRQAIEASSITTLLARLEQLHVALTVTRRNLQEHFTRRQPIERALRQARSLGELADAARSHTDFLDWYGGFANNEVGKAQATVDLVQQVIESVKKYGFAWMDSTRDVNLFMLLSTDTGWGFLPVFLIRLKELADETVKKQGKSEAQLYLEDHFAESMRPTSVPELLNILEDSNFSSFIINVNGTFISLAKIAEIVRRIQTEIRKTGQAPQTGISNTLYSEIGFDSYGIVDIANRLLRQTVVPAEDKAKPEAGSARSSWLHNQLQWLRRQEQQADNVEEFKLHSDVYITIGRQADQKFVIPEQLSGTVSREHAALFWYRKAFVIKVLGRNGLKLDGQSFVQGSIVRIDTATDHMLELGGVRVMLQFSGEGSHRKGRLSLASKQK